MQDYPDTCIEWKDTAWIQYVMLCQEIASSSNNDILAFHYSNDGIMTNRSDDNDNRFAKAQPSIDIFRK